MKFAALVLFVSIALWPAAWSQTRSEPQPLPPVSSIPAPRDVPFVGVIKLSIDTTDIDRKIWRITQSIPVSRPGPVTLLYAQWIPGNHAPRGPIYNYAGLKISANGKPVAWKRDPGDVYAFHVEAPPGARTLELEAQFLTPLETAQGPAMVTPEMLRLNWYVAPLYPAGYFARRIKFDVSVKLPPGWDYATALETDSTAAGFVRFKTASYETLVDSPLIAGKHMKKWDLDPGGRSRVTLNAMADTPGELDAEDGHVTVLRNLVKQGDKLFGARHFGHYDFLLSISERLGTAGIEHAQSSDNGVRNGYFSLWDTGFISRDLLAHEYVHSWNGKFRRPADLWTANLNTPMRNSLMWVYEGQTQYWGAVLAARAGFLTKDQALDVLAGVAAIYDEARVGRAWRPLVDTTNDPIIAARRSLPWGSWQRSEDYYSEGQLVWLDADTLIREKSGGKRSLDDFARTFFSMNDGDWGQLTYTEADVVAALNKVEQHDWAGFLRERVSGVAPDAPLAGIERGGYRLVYSETPNAYWRATESRARSVNLTYSLGLSADSAGKVTAVNWEGPAFKAGLTTAVTITGVNAEAFSADRIRAAVAATKAGKRVELLLKQGDAYRTVSIDYTGGARYPRLERVAGKPALLDDILKARN
ncbi:MAG: peptidase M61 [Alphaproteobacteria bacterium]|nr:peptidase M61 [Alphaproteobacteria bacterium]